MKQLITLDDLYIAKPCSATWESMLADDKVRSCSLCSKKVYNISAMTRNEAEALLAKHGLSVCMGLFRRADGTIMTDDCPIALRKMRNGLQKILRIIATITSFVLSINPGHASDAQDRERFGPLVNSFGFGTAPSVLPRTGGYGAPIVQIRKERFERRATSASECVVIATYLDCKTMGKIDLSHPVQARFFITKILKGPSIGPELPLLYEFKELPGKAEAAFTEDSMPTHGDRFILYLQYARPDDGLYRTFNGSAGRVPLSPFELSNVEAELKSVEMPDSSATK